MPDATYFAEKALKCRELSGRTADRYVAEQLRMWADDFDMMAQARIRAAFASVK